MTDETVTAWIGLGSNLDDPVARVRRALDRLARHPQLESAGCSGLYLSPPMGPPDQPEYVNAAMGVRTALPPEALLELLQAEEAAQERRRGRRWGPRTLDLDLLLYGERRIRQPSLVVPHPGMHERSFVLYPLAEVAPAARVPGKGEVRALLAACPADGLRRIQEDGTAVAVSNE